MNSTFGRYVVIGRVAETPTATLWKAHDPDGERDVAIKELRPSPDSGSETLSLFRLQFRRHAAIDDPNIIRVFDFVDRADGPYVIEEWVDGASLARVVGRAGRLQPEQALSVTRGALSGLARTHAVGVIHGDIRPTTVVVDTDGVSKLTDIGFGHPRGQATHQYASPEASRDDPLDPRSDVYSVGAITHELLTGRRHTAGCDIDAGCGGRIDDLLTRATAADPDRRPADAQSFLDELEEAARDRFGAGWLAQGSVAGFVASLTGASAAVGVGDQTVPAATVLASTVVNPQVHEPSQLQADTAVAGNQRRSTRPRWLLPAAVVAAVAVTLGVVGCAAGGDDSSDSAPGTAAASVPAAVIPDVTEPVSTAASAATTSPAAATTSTAAATTTSTAVAAGGGAGTFAATATTGAWEWISPPDPFDGSINPPGDEALIPQPGEVDKVPANVELTGVCDGVGPCHLEVTIDDFLQSFVSSNSFFDTDLTPTGDGYTGSVTEKFVTDCSPVLNEFVRELTMTRAADGSWTGTSHRRETYSGHVDMQTDANGGTSYTVCDGHDFTSTFVLAPPA